MGIVNADTIPRGESFIEDNQPAAMMYSHDPDRVLAIRPADCPVIIGYGKDAEGKPLQFILHLGWQDEEAGFAEEALRVAQNLGYDVADMHFVITPSGEQLDFTKREGTDERFQHPGWKDAMQSVSDTRFRMSTVGFAQDRLKDAGVESERIFIDGSDTTAEDSGYSSQRRATESERAFDKQQREDVIPPTRDLVVAMMPEYEKKMRENSLRYLQPQLGKQATRS